jgi:hypothetical protein
MELFVQHNQSVGWRLVFCFRNENDFFFLQELRRATFFVFSPPFYDISTTVNSMFGEE